MTQEGLAEMAEIHWKTLGYVESGKRDFGVTILARLAACLRVSGDQLLAGIEIKDDKRLKAVALATAPKRKRS